MSPANVCFKKGTDDCPDPDPGSTEESNGIANEFNFHADQSPTSNAARIKEVR